jgi:hypothetical protein
VDITTGRTGDDRADLAPLDRALLREPIEYIFADHMRQRSLCRLMDELAGEPQYDPKLGELVALHLTVDMALHVIDEEDDLFPLLRRRARPEDDIERVLGLLSREHAADESLGHEVAEGLREAARVGQGCLAEGLRERLSRFARQQRRHLAVENAIVMPLAQRRLTSSDREQLARRMAARRGVALPT